MMATNSARAGRREWLGLGVLALPCLLYAMDLTVLDLAIPRLVADLAPSSAELLWIVDIYGFVLAGALITMGTLGDRIGRRRLLLGGASAFGVISVLAAFSTSARMLIATRALLGLAGATLAPSTLAFIQTMFVDPRQRMFAIGVWGASFSLGGAIGPVLGGVVLAHFPWGAVFLLGVPVMVLLLATGRALLPEVKAPDAGRLDVPSAALSLAAVLSGIYGVKEAARGGAVWLCVFALALAAALGVAFVRRQRALADPLIDLRMFRSRTLVAALVTNVLAIFVVFAVHLFIAQHLQLALGLTPLQAGVWMLPSSAGFVVGAMLVPVAARRVPPYLVIAGGLVLASAGVLLVAQLAGLAGLVAGSVVLSLGISPVPTLATAMVLEGAPPERAGAASGINETSSELGGALGIALLGSLGTAVYRHNLTGGAPFGTDTFAGAVALAAKLPQAGASGAADTAGWLANCRHAFDRSFVVMSTTGAGILLATAVIVVVLLRKRGDVDRRDAVDGAVIRTRS